MKIEKLKRRSKEIKMKKFLVIAIVLVISLQFSGCAVIVADRINQTVTKKAYPGPDLPDNETALVNSFFPALHGRWNKTSKIGIVSVDGLLLNDSSLVKLSGGVPVESSVRVLDGMHDFIVYAWYDPDVSFRKVTFRVEKAHEYEITSHSTESKWTIIKVEDKTSGKIVLEMKEANAIEKSLMN